MIKYNIIILVLAEKFECIYYTNIYVGMIHI